MLIGKLIDARNHANLKQADLADRLGKPQSFISKVERRERRLDVLEFVLIARAIGVDVGELFGEVERLIPPKTRL